MIFKNLHELENAPTTSKSGKEIECQKNRFLQDLKIHD